jgi:hypothetical protein
MWLSRIGASDTVRLGQLCEPFLCSLHILQIFCRCYTKIRNQLIDVLKDFWYICIVEDMQECEETLPPWEVNGRWWKVTYQCSKPNKSNGCLCSFVESLWRVSLHLAARICKQPYQDASDLEVGADSASRWIRKCGE